MPQCLQMAMDVMSGPLIGADSRRLPHLEVDGDRLPFGSLLFGLTPPVTIEAIPPHPSNVVVLCAREGRGPIHPYHATPENRGPGRAADRFRIKLPPIRKGHAFEYRLELQRLGQCIATLPADGSWLPVTGVGPPSDQPDNDTSSSNDINHTSPRFHYTFSFFARMTVKLRAEIIGVTPDGFRVNFYSLGGRLVGPRIDASEQDGVDLVCVRPDGIARLEKRAVWHNADGAIIYEQAGGITDLGPDGYAIIQTGDWTGAPPVVLTPTWSTAHPAWQWLNRCQGVALGRTLTNHLRAETDVYLAEVGARLRDD